MRADRALVVLPRTTASGFNATDATEAAEALDTGGAAGAAGAAGAGGGAAVEVLGGPGAAPSAPEVGTGWLATKTRPILLAVACTLVALGVGFLLPTKPKDAVALLAGAVIVTGVLLRPVIGAVLLVAVVPATSGLAPGLPVSHVRLSEAVIGLVGVTLLASVRRTEAVPWGKLDWALLGYGLMWALFAVLAAHQLHQHLTLGQWGTALGQLQFFLVYRGVRVAVRSERERRMALTALLVASLPVAVLAIVQEMRVHAVQSFINTLTGGLTGGAAPTASGSVRVTGPFVNWAALAGYLLPILLVLVAFALSKAELRRARWFAAVGVVGALALFLTLEQSALVCLVAGVFVLLRRYDRDGRTTRLFLIAVAALVVAASPVLIGRFGHELAGSPGTGRIPWVPQTLSFRWGVWSREYFPAIGARPLTGYGMVYPSSIRWPFPESQYISFLMEGGVVMTAAFGVLAWAMLRRTWSAARGANPIDQALGYALTIGVVSMLIMNITWPFLSNGGMPQVLWALMGLLLPAWRPAGRDSGALWHRSPADLSGGALARAMSRSTA